jgi:hypothetical protein
MAIQHTNRKRDTYYLHQGQSKTGTPTCFFSKKKDGVVAEAIPEGYEVYEKPSAQVFLRRIQPRLVTDEEVALIANGVRRYAGQDNFLIDVEKNGIVVYLPDQDWDELARLLSGGQLSKCPPGLERTGSYSPMMRFDLADAGQRTFHVQRWCFRGSIDTWIPLMHPADNLARLAAQFLPHLGRETFVDLL